MYGYSLAYVVQVEKIEAESREKEPIEVFQRMIPVVAMVVVLSVLELFFSFFSVFSYTTDSAAAAPAYQQVKHSFMNERCTFIKSACESSCFQCSSYTGCNFLFSTLAAFFLSALSLLYHNFLRCVFLFIIHQSWLTTVKWMWWRLAFQTFHYSQGKMGCLVQSCHAYWYACSGDKPAVL